MSSQDTFAHWRDSARIPRFFVVDARAAIVVIMFFFRPNVYTFSAAIGFLVFLAILDYFKIPLLVAMRIVKCWVAGSKKHRVPRA